MVANILNVLACKAYGITTDNEASIVRYILNVFEDTKVVIRSRKSKDRQYNGVLLLNLQFSVQCFIDH